MSCPVCLLPTCECYAAGVRVTGDTLRQTPLVTGDADGTRTRAVYVAPSAPLDANCMCGGQGLCAFCVTSRELAAPPSDDAAPLREALGEWLVELMDRNMTPVEANLYDALRAALTPTADAS